MRATGQCPKCNNRDLLRIEGSSGAYGSGNNIPVGWTVFSENRDDIAKLVDKFGA